MTEIDENVEDHAVEDTGVESTSPARSVELVKFWADFAIDPVEIALPRGVGYTLRTYRTSSEITLSDLDREEDDFSVLDRPVITSSDEDDEYDQTNPSDDDQDDDNPPTSDKPEDEDEDEDSPTDEDEDSPTDEDEDEDEDEIAFFLGRGGRLYLFASPEVLVDFIRSDEDHDFAQIPEWSEVQERITPDLLVPDENDRYELDLVVENLRGGVDVWDTELIIKAGEVARDLGCALRIDAVRTALAPGSPLDDLDEALRSADAGGFSGFFARRRLKKIAAQQAALGWRTIIGKISSVVDWRE